MAATHLVVGASGQLGSAVVRELVARGEVVRALVRDPARVRLPDGVEVVRADLTDISTLRAAVPGCERVIATATAATPRPGDSIRTVDDAGYANLLAVCATSGVERFVLASTQRTALDRAVPLHAAKHRTEARLVGSGLDARIVRLAPFMDVWLALVGSELPLRGAENATVLRPFPFLERYRHSTGRAIDDKGVLGVPGNADVRHAFVAVADAARLLVAAAADDVWGSDPGQPLEAAGVDCGGPEALDWNQVAAVFAAVLGRPVRVRTTPTAVFAVMQQVLRPFSPAGSNVMGLNRLAATDDTATWPAYAVRLGEGPPVTVEQFLRAKAAMPG